MHVHDFFFFLYFVTFRELLIRLRTTDGKAAFIHLMSEPLLASYEEIIVHDFPYLLFCQWETDRSYSVSTVVMKKNVSLGSSECCTLPDMLLCMLPCDLDP